MVKNMTKWTITDPKGQKETIEAKTIYINKHNDLILTNADPDRQPEEIIIILSPDVWRVVRKQEE
jgi:hypothetical protein